MRRWPIIGLFLVLAGLFASPVGAVRQYQPDPFIFRLKISGCVDNPSRQIAQTGFRVKGWPGIITALHGVAGCKQINAIAETGVFFNDLTLAQVDIDHDVALLSNPNQPISAAEGLGTGDPYQLGNNDILHLVGYPETATFAIRRNTQPPEIRPLGTLLQPGDMTTSTMNRNSPNPQIDILSVQVNMMHGDSGAPLLDDLNEVDGIADGGWDDGKVQIGWAIPFSEIHFQGTDSSEVKARLQLLGNQDPAKAPVFSMTLDPGSVEQVTVQEPTPTSSPSVRWRGTVTFMAGPQDQGTTFDYIFLYNGAKDLSSFKLYGDDQALPTLFGNTIMQAITLYHSGQKDYIHFLAPYSVACTDMSGPDATVMTQTMHNSVMGVLGMLPDLAFPNGGTGGSPGVFQGEQTIQGTDTKHYSFDPATLNSGNNNTPGITYLSDDIWTASDDNRLVQVMTLAQVQGLQLGTHPFTGYVQLTGQFVNADENLSIPIPEECTSPGNSVQVPTTDINQPSNPIHQAWVAIAQADSDVRSNGASSTAWDLFQGPYRYELQDEVNDLSDQGMHQDWQFDEAHSSIKKVTALGSNSISLDTCEYWRWQQKDAQGQVVDQSQDYPGYTLWPQTIVLTQMDMGSGPDWYVTDEYTYVDKGVCNP